MLPIFFLFAEVTHTLSYGSSAGAPMYSIRTLNDLDEYSYEYLWIIVDINFFVCQKLMLINKHMNAC